MSSTSEISKIYSQYHCSLKASQEEFNDEVKHFVTLLEKRYNELLKDHVVRYRDIARYVSAMHPASTAPIPPVTSIT